MVCTCLPLQAKCSIGRIKECSREITNRWIFAAINNIRNNGPWREILKLRISRRNQMIIQCWQHVLFQTEGAFKMNESEHRNTLSPKLNRGRWMREGDKNSIELAINMPWAESWTLKMTWKFEIGLLEYFSNFTERLSKKINKFNNFQIRYPLITSEINGTE